MRWAWILVGFLALSLVGCNDRQQTIDTGSGAPRQMVSSRELVARARPPIPDIPIPMGFNLYEPQSRNVVAGGARWVDQVYRGRDNHFAIKRFYMRQMPVSGWQLMTDIYSQGVITLDFEKQSERCRVEISKGSLLKPIRIWIQLWPVGVIPPPPAEPPLQ